MQDNDRLKDSIAASMLLLLLQNQVIAEYAEPSDLLDSGYVPLFQLRMQCCTEAANTFLQSSRDRGTVGDESQMQQDGTACCWYFKISMQRLLSAALYLQVILCHPTGKLQQAISSS
jgi:hypothetical protein